MKLELTYDDSSARKAIEAAPKRGRDALEAAHFRRAQDLLDAAVPNTPMRSGRLRASRYATRTMPVEAGFSAPYAAAVHEMHARHAVGGWKFLETSLIKVGNEGADPFAAHFAAAFERGESLATAPARHPTQPNQGSGGGASARPRGRA